MFFFKRCEPVVPSSSKLFMILDSIFGKIITVCRSKLGRSKYKVFSKRLENYGQSFDALSPFVLAR